MEVSSHAPIKYNHGPAQSYTVGDSKRPLDLPSAQSYSSFVQAPRLSGFDWNDPVGDFAAQFAQGLDRLSERRRHSWYKDELSRRGIPYVLLAGPLRRRVAAVLAHLA